jgi:hypothetical protein
MVTELPSYYLPAVGITVWGRDVFGRTDLDGRFVKIQNASLFRRAILYPISFIFILLDA